MDTVPTVWSFSDRMNLTRVRDWCLLVKMTCGASKEDRACIAEHRASAVSDPELAKLLGMYGCDLGVLLDWIQQGSAALAAVPSLVFSSVQRDAWRRVLTEAEASAKSLENVLAVHAQSCEKALDALPDDAGLLTDSSASDSDDASESSSTSSSE